MSDSSPDMVEVVIVIAIVVLLRKGIHVRRGTWSRYQWIRFVLQLAVCACLVAVPFVIPQQGLNPDWAPAARVVYVVTEIALMLYGIFSGLWLIRAFANGAPPPQVVNAMLLTFVGLTLALGVAAWTEQTASIPFQQSGAIILGIFSVWIAARVPEWVRHHLIYRQISGIISETGTRLAYGAIGLVLIAFGLLGRAHIFR